MIDMNEQYSKIPKLAIVSLILAGIATADLLFLGLLLLRFLSPFLRVSWFFFNFHYPDSRLFYNVHYLIIPISAVSIVTAIIAKNKNHRDNKIVLISFYLGTIVLIISLLILFVIITGFRLTN